jgi:uncharacterized protein involved in exopolysaccharide biosynthesis
MSFIDAPEYEAQAKLQLVSNRADVRVSPEQGAAQVDKIDETLVNSEVSWFQSPGVLREVLEPWRSKVEARRPSGWRAAVASLVHLPLDLPTRVYRWAHGTAEPSAFDRWVAHVRKRLVVSAVRQSNVIEMSLRDGNPEFTAQVLKELIAYRMKQQTNLRQQNEAVAFYDEQIRLLGDRIHQSEEALRAFYASEGIAGGPEERKAVRDRLTEIRTNRTRTRTDLAEARVQVEFLEKALKAVPRRVGLPSAGATSMQTRLLELMLERTKLLATYAPTSVKILDLDQQIADTKRLLQEQSRLIADMTSTVNPTYADVEKRLIETHAQLAALEARSATLAEQEREYREEMERAVSGTSRLEQLETDLERAGDAHRVYVAKREDARFASALDASQILNIAVIQPARVPTMPIPGHATMSIVLGALAGLMLGATLAFVRDRIDPTVKSVAEVSRLTGMPILGEVSP